MIRVALVSRAAAPYLKALQESFAEAMGSSGRFDIIWPDDVLESAQSSGCKPIASNLTISSVAARSATRLMPRLLRVSYEEQAIPRLASGAVWHLLDSMKPDLVWIHEFSPFTIVALAYAKLHQVPLIVSTEVGRANARFFSRPVRVWHWWWGHFVDGVIACCPAAQHTLASTAAPVIDAYHAVDSRVFTPVSSHSLGPVVFVYVGSLLDRKGIDLLLAAAVRLKQNCTIPFYLRIVGSGNTAKIAEMVQTLGLASITEFTGRLEGEALREAVRSADVFVLPTRQDTYAAVVHEAACLGLPLLVSRHAGAAEAMVHDDETGYVIEPHDTDAFAARMQLMLNPDTRLAMAGKARALGESLSAHRRAQSLWNWMQREFLHSPASAHELAVTP